MLNKALPAGQDQPFSVQPGEVESLTEFYDAVHALKLDENLDGLWVVGLIVILKFLQFLEEFFVYRLRIYLSIEKFLFFYKSSFLLVNLGKI